METDTEGFFPIVKTKFGVYKGVYEGIHLVKGERLKKGYLTPVYICNGLADCYEMEFRWLSAGVFIDFPSVVKGKTPRSILKEGANCYLIKYPNYQLFEDEKPDDDSYVCPTINAKVYFFRYEPNSKAKDPIIVDLDEKFEEELNEVVDDEEQVVEKKDKKIAENFENNNEVVYDEFQAENKQKDEGIQISIEEILQQSQSRLLDEDLQEENLSGEAVQDEQIEEAEEDVISGNYVEEADAQSETQKIERNK